jgi:HK97 family phage major capsid protein
MDIVELKGHFDSAATEMKALVERQSEEIKKHGETSAETAKRMSQLSQTLDSMQDEVKKYDERMKDLEIKANRPGYGSAVARKSVGQAFVESDEYKRASERRMKSVDPVMLDGSFFRKDITSASASAGDLVDAMRLPEIYSDPADRETHIRNFMNVGTTNSNAIEFMEELLFDNQAGPQYSASPSPATELVAKNKSDITFDLKTVSVVTLAHYVIASRQILDDAAMLRSFIDGRLRYGLALEEDAQILYGTGSSGDMSGIMTNANIQNAGGVAAGDTFIDHIRKAIALGRTAEYSMNGILLNPSDWAEIELTKGDDGHYVWVTVPAGGESRLWRVPVYETTAINAGDFLVGNWNLAAQLWDRQSSTIRVSESHNDLFVKNGVAILAEERVALTVYRPQAFVKGSFDPAST